jgi:hypothetical protein
MSETARAAFELLTREFDSMATRLTADWRFRRAEASSARPAQRNGWPRLALLAWIVAPITRYRVVQPAFTQAHVA